jgi:hypothetical protein
MRDASLWPEKGSAVFTTDGDPWHHAFLMSPGSIQPYAEGYRRAAEIAFQHVAENLRDQDYLLFPIVFLWRHHLELQLKEIIRLARLIQNEDSDGPFPKTHRLMQLWLVARPQIEKDPDGICDVVERLLQQVETFDMDSMAFRYPTDRDGNLNIPSSLPHLNLGAVHEQMTRIANFLDAVVTEFTVRLGRLQEQLVAVG